MNRLKNYLPMHFFGCLILGIVSQFFIKIWTFSFTNIIISFLILLGFLIFVKNKVAITFLTFGCFYLIGIGTVYVDDDRNYKDYYQLNFEENSTAIFTIKKVLKSGLYHDKYQVEVSQVDQTKTRGTILLNVQKDSLLIPFQVDEKLLVKPSFVTINSALNPHQFNYKAYLEKQGIYQQVFIDSNQCLRLENKGFSLVGLSARFRTNIQESLQKHNFKKDELAVINALLLGKRQDISKELITDYSNAGAIHILAVSGLHVGVILLLLTVVFKPLERFKNGRFIKTICIVLCLWMFAFIAGLSASVVRAVTMFTFLAIGLTFKRKNVIIFSLITSMFFLLLVKPMFLFDVGFQLSYLAVFSIVWVQPKLYEIWKPKLKVTDFFWQLFTVSIAAQLGVLPLSIYYFQQFPGLFLLSNFVIIPCLMYILFGGILVIFLALINCLPDFLVTIYGTVISWMNGFVSWISHQEAFLFKEISISFVLMIFCYVATVFGIRFLIDKTSKKLLYFLITILTLQTIYFYGSTENNNQRELIVFHKNRHAIIAKKIGVELHLQHDLDTLTFRDDYSLKSFRIKKGIHRINQTNFKNFINFSNKQILIIDSLGVYKVKGLQKPIVILQYSPKINLERLIQTLKPSKIIADGSNYKSYIETWKVISKKIKTPFHYTGEKGAFRH